MFSTLILFRAVYVNHQSVHWLPGRLIRVNKVLVVMYMYLTTSTVTNFISFSYPIPTDGISNSGEWFVGQTPAEIVGVSREGVSELSNTAGAPQLRSREAGNGRHYASTRAIVTTASTCKHIRNIMLSHNFVNAKGMA